MGAGGLLVREEQGDGLGGGAIGGLAGILHQQVVVMIRDGDIAIAGGHADDLRDVAPWGGGRAMLATMPAAQASASSSPRRATMEASSDWL